MKVDSNPSVPRADAGEQPADEKGAVGTTAGGDTRDKQRDKGRSLPFLKYSFTCDGEETSDRMRWREGLLSNRCSVFLHLAKLLISERGVSLILAASMVGLSVFIMLTFFLVVPLQSSNSAIRSARSLLWGLNTSASSTQESPDYDVALPATLQHLYRKLQICSPFCAFLGCAVLWLFNVADAHRRDRWLLTCAMFSAVLGIVLLLALAGTFIDTTAWHVTAELEKQLHRIYEKALEQKALCKLNTLLPCSGYDLCCVTNTVPLNRSEALPSEEEWQQLCFLTLADGTAVDRKNRNVTLKVRQQCTEMDSVAAINSSHLYSTACSVSLGTQAQEDLSQKMVRCDAYVVGHLNISVSFAVLSGFILSTYCFVFSYLSVSEFWTRQKSRFTASPTSVGSPMATEMLLADELVF